MQFIEYMRKHSRCDRASGSAILPETGNGSGDLRGTSQQEHGTPAQKPKIDWAVDRWINYSPAARRVTGRRNTQRNQRNVLKRADLNKPMLSEEVNTYDLQEEEPGEDTLPAEESSDRRLERQAQRVFDLKFEQEFNDMYSDINYGDDFGPIEAVILPINYDEVQGPLVPVLDSPPIDNISVEALLLEENKVLEEGKSLKKTNISDHSKDVAKSSSDAGSCSSSGDVPEHSIERGYLISRIRRNGGNHQPLTRRATCLEGLTTDEKNFKVPVNKHGTTRPSVPPDLCAALLRLPVVAEPRIIYAPQGVGKTSFCSKVSQHGMLALEVQQLPTRYRNNATLSSLSSRGILVFTNRLRDTNEKNTLYVRPSEHRFTAVNIVRSWKSLMEVRKDYKLIGSLTGRNVIDLPDTCFVDSVVGKYFTPVSLKDLHEHGIRTGKIRTDE